MTTETVSRVVYEGECCDCCALMIANGDNSGCRNYYGHDHPEPQPEKIAEGYAVIAGEREDSEDWDHVITGPCELCGQGDGYMSGHEFAIIR